MFPVGFIRVVGQPCFPRVRGDVPDILMDIAEPQVFSPRARGCSLHNTGPDTRAVVFPACAGMFLSICNVRNVSSCFPRVRGDVPARTHASPTTRLFSPRARGCSEVPCRPQNRATVFPACAGMFRISAPSIRFDGGFPRVRGDVPTDQSAYGHHHEFSPRARGCS